MSASVRDIHLRLGYEPPAGGALVDDIDRVKATAVWVDHDTAGNLLTASSVIWPAAANDLKSFKNDYIKQFGVYFNDFNTEMGATYGIGLQFSVKPTGAGPFCRWDVTRQYLSNRWEWDSSGALVVSADGAAWPSGDTADDDKQDDDEDNDPENGKLYSLDRPGITLATPNANLTSMVLRSNFREFVRVTFDAPRPTGNTFQGSRCSSNVLWHAHFWIDADPTFGFGGKIGWKQQLNKPIKAGMGHIPNTSFNYNQ